MDRVISLLRIVVRFVEGDAPTAPDRALWWVALLGSVAFAVWPGAPPPWLVRLWSISLFTLWLWGRWILKPWRQP